MSAKILLDAESHLRALEHYARITDQVPRSTDPTAGRPVTIIFNSNLHPERLRGDWDAQQAGHERERAQRALPARREGIGAGDGQSQSEQPR